MFKYYALVDLIRLKQELIICMRMSSLTDENQLVVSQSMVF